MGYTRVVFNEELSKRLQTGVDIIGNAVGSTLGYSGRNVLIPETDPQKFGRHKITKDGVSVARSIATLEDPIANAAAQMIKDVAGEAHKLSGDGTTTATVLAQAIFKNGLEYLSANPTANPIELNNGIQYAVKQVVEFIKDKAIQIQDDQDKLIEVATIASNNNKDMGKLVGEAMASLGKEGIINVESPLYSWKTEYKPTLGFTVNSGYISEWLINQKEKRTCQFTAPLILLCEDKISLFHKEILPAMQIAERTKRPLLLICESVDGEALNTLITNATRGFKICAVRVPAIGTKKLDLLIDIQAAVGGYIFSQTAGKLLDQITESDFGNCESCEVSLDSTQLFGGLGSKEGIALREAQLRNQLESAQSDGEIRWLRNRLTTLTAKRGTIYVGGYSDLEKKELSDRIDDAICACRSAMEEGVLPGGGIALVKFNYSPEIERIFSSDFISGIDIILKSKSEPFVRMVMNSGKTQEEAKKMAEASGAEFQVGYNAKTSAWENLVSQGIVDPAKVTRVALENAASIAGQLLTATCAVFYEK